MRASWQTSFLVVSTRVLRQALIGRNESCGLSQASVARKMEYAN